MLINSKINYRKIANITTIFRIFLGLPLAILLFLNNTSLSWFLLLFAGFTDWLDGWAAKRSGGGSDWGAQADPLADKIILLAPFSWMAPPLIAEFPLNSESNICIDVPLDR